MNKKALVIGSGPAGIGVALGLENDCIVLEASGQVGGFSMSIEINGAIFDYGGHSFHTPHPEVKELVFNSLEMFEQKRDARCFVNGEIIPYPFQKNYHLLSNVKLVKDCDDGLRTILDATEPKDFEEFITNKFGVGISEHFMLPYNRKLWGRDLKRLSADWTAERVASPGLTKEKFDTEGGKRKPLQSDTTVAYPAKGGFGEIFKALSKKIQHIQTNCKVIRIDPFKKLVYTENRGIFEYEYLVSTIPINQLVKLIHEIPPTFIGMAESLDYLSLQLGLIVVNHPVDTVIQRIYSAEEHIPAHKTALNHNSSDYLRHLPKHGIMMEIAEGPEKKLQRTDLKQWIKESLLEMGLVQSLDEIEHIELINAKYAYPVPSHDRSHTVQKIQDWLNENKIFSVGRFGQWAYINSDEALERGVVLGKQIAAL